MHPRESNINFVSYKDENQVLHELFDSLHSGLQGNLETPMRGGDFVFGSVQMMYYSCHKVKYRLSG